MKITFRNRTEAGRLLAQRLKLTYANRPDVLVLGLPRGGVPVAYEVAKVLHAPLDICLVRKLGRCINGCVRASSCLQLNRARLDQS
jgi:putative phosphoribosyl transferase